MASGFRSLLELLGIWPASPAPPPVIELTYVTGHSQAFFTVEGRASVPLVEVRAHSYPFVMITDRLP